MSDLQLSLLGLGAVLVAGVWGYNKLQERKYRQAAEKVFRNEQPDVLVPAEEASAASAPAAYDADEYAARREPGFADAADTVEDDGEFVAAAETGAAHEALPVSADMQAGYGAAPAYAETAYLDAPDVSDAPAAAALRNAPSADWCDDSIDLIA
ncbi:MAG TPA: hypothetical protein VN028_05430, partial [Rhodocyclaceae bacterium]|nr:hypothetical protein [Rhodocyclaceae bacterium]